MAESAMRLAAFKPPPSEPAFVRGCCFWQKTLSLERLKQRLLQEIRSADSDEKSLATFKEEMELLLQEKMAHVEELRQIHADINAMENVIKQAEDSRGKALDVARHLYEEYKPLKSDVDHMRRERLGLERLPDITEEENGHIISTLLAEKPKMDWPPEREENLLSMAPQPTYISTQPSLLMNATVPKNDPRPLPPQPGPAPTFRQQPPPMKSCLSCHQQIHRNAPICPLCKAKSRSRNPKKPKKKD
nr:EOG090X0H8R [Lepidurus arcticus]